MMMVRAVHARCQSNRCHQNPLHFLLRPSTSNFSRVLPGISPLESFRPPTCPRLSLIEHTFLHHIVYHQNRMHAHTRRTSQSEFPLSPKQAVTWVMGVSLHYFRPHWCSLSKYYRPLCCQTPSRPHPRPPGGPQTCSEAPPCVMTHALRMTSPFHYRGNMTRDFPFKIEQE